MAVKITVDRAAEVVAMCKKIQNSDILDLFQGVASKLEEAGVNAVTEQIFESCKTSRQHSTLTQKVTIC